MLITLAFALTRMLVKRTWLAAMIAGLVVAFVAVSQAGTEYLLLNALFAPAVAAVDMGVLVGFGMFALMTTFLTNYIVMQGGMTADFSRLYAPTGLWLMALVAAAAAFGLLRVSRRRTAIREV